MQLLSNKHSQHLKNANGIFLIYNFSMNKTTVKNEDLNGIDALNGKGSVSQRDLLTMGLKGALNGYLSFSQINDEFLWVQNQKEQIIEFRTEQLIYENLPKGLTKYRIEQKNIENGSVAIVKVLDNYYAVNYVQQEYNIYREPAIIKINEPKSEILHNKTFNVLNGEAVIIRDNMNMKPVFTRVARYIKATEKVLFQIEKNLTSSAPKGILNLKNMEFDESQDGSTKKAMENVINGQDTFYVIRAIRNEEGEVDTNVMLENEEDIYIPIELTDRTEALWKNYLNLKEQIKEVIGALVNGNIGKKERQITTEVDSQQGMAESAKNHTINIRIEDWNNFNEVFGENVQVIMVDEGDEEEEPLKEGEENEKDN